MVKRYVVRLSEEISHGALLFFIDETYDFLEDPYGNKYRISTEPSSTLTHENGGEVKLYNKYEIEGPEISSDKLNVMRTWSTLVVSLEIVG